MRCLVIDGLVGWICIYLFIHWISGKGDLGSWTPRPAGKGGRGKGGPGLLKSMASPRKVWYAALSWEVGHRIE